MNQDDLAFFKKLVGEKISNALEELGYLESSSITLTPQDLSGDLSNVSFHMADRGSETNDQELAFALASRENRYLHHLYDALGRIKDGTFGVCRSCGAEIARARLEAVPHATQCLDCKVREEKANRGKQRSGAIWIDTEFMVDQDDI